MILPSHNYDYYGAKRATTYTEGDVKLCLFDNLVTIEMPASMAKLFLVGKLIEFAVGEYRILGTPNSVERASPCGSRFVVRIDPEWIKKGRRVGTKPKALPLEEGGFP